MAEAIHQLEHREGQQGCLQCVPLDSSGGVFSGYRGYWPFLNANGNYVDEKFSFLQLDEKRGNYKLLEQKLIDVLIKACNWDPKKTEDAIKIKNWKKPWKKGDAAGDLAKTLEEVVELFFLQGFPAKSLMLKRPLLFAYENIK